MLGITAPSKKAMADAAKSGNPMDARSLIVETSIFGAEFHGDGEYTVVGPDPYNKRNYFATITVQGGKIVKVR